MKSNKQTPPFIKDLVRPHVLHENLEAGYKRMGQDEAREKEALEFSEAVIADLTD